MAIIRIEAFSSPELSFPITAIALMFTNLPVYNLLLPCPIKKMVLVAMQLSTSSIVGQNRPSIDWSSLFDFVAPIPSLEGELCNMIPHNPINLVVFKCLLAQVLIIFNRRHFYINFVDIKPWMGKLQVLHKLASREGSSARIFKAIADPPTTSLQRLKGLTTGGLPTFIDVGNSFGAPAILEDNLISQLVQNGKQVVMMGDDTWLQLFPHHFNASFPFPSFNVKDLHTVDDGCTRNLFPSLYDEDWDVLIAHFLGVDHAGHIFGVNSVPMIEKLEQYNFIIEASSSSLTFIAYSENSREGG
ncbi:hypothetical protein RHGRI_033001 [Rhododendron griersonianum]|uniref:GPI ethanolamine phosphate transferase 3 n=1 Tax=Rhododendron griersonianum TaxID=479676 RepID=A0AAV6IHB8_9ERIC|nr:hypothetical protein RHGRI_033001 [Rhododendron griersonianum]